MAELPPPFKAPAVLLRHRQKLLRHLHLPPTPVNHPSPPKSKPSAIYRSSITGKLHLRRRSPPPPAKTSLASNNSSPAPGSCSGQPSHYQPSADLHHPQPMAVGTISSAGDASPDIPSPVTTHRTILSSPVPPLGWIPAAWKIGSATVEERELREEEEGSCGKEEKNLGDDQEAHPMAMIKA